MSEWLDAIEDFDEERVRPLLASGVDLNVDAHPRRCSRRTR
jgi:hypothetical protein